jgi:hypothetical protein
VIHLATGDPLGDARHDSAGETGETVAPGAVVPVSVTSRWLVALASGAVWAGGKSESKLEESETLSAAG